MLVIYLINGRDEAISTVIEMFSRVYHTDRMQCFISIQRGLGEAIILWGNDEVMTVMVDCHIQAKVIISSCVLRKDLALVLLLPFLIPPLPPFLEYKHVKALSFIFVSLSLTDRAPHT